MKHILIQAVFFFYCFIAAGALGFAQEKPVAVAVEERGNHLVFEVTNTTTITREITLTLTKREGLRGNARPVTKVVGAGQTVPFYNMTFKGPYRWSYKSNHKPKPTVAEQEALDEAKLAYMIDSLNDIDITKGILVFDKTGCPRCHMTTSYLMDNNIDFKLLNVTENTEYQKLMWALLRKNNVSPDTKEILMPVIMINGKLTHTHEDLRTFLKTIPY